MNDELRAAITFACVEAMKSLGDRYKGMSCFMDNWSSEEDSAEFVELEST